jgi:hypothetical protein
MSTKAIASAMRESDITFGTFHNRTVRLIANCTRVTGSLLPQSAPWLE